MDLSDTNGAYVSDDNTEMKDGLVEDRSGDNNDISNNNNNNNNQLDINTIHRRLVQNRSELFQLHREIQGQPPGDEKIIMISRYNELLAISISLRQQEVNIHRANACLPCTTNYHFREYIRDRSGNFEYIWKGYTPTVPTVPNVLPIEAEIRARNNKFYTEEELSQFNQKSNWKQPTFGNCNNCWRVGPLGSLHMPCRNYDHEDVICSLVKIRQDCGARFTMDAHGLAELMSVHDNLPVLVAANRKIIKGDEPPIREITFDRMIRYMAVRFDGGQEHNENNRDIEKWNTDDAKDLALSLHLS